MSGNDAFDEVYLIDDFKENPHLGQGDIILWPNETDEYRIISMDS